MKWHDVLPLGAHSQSCSIWLPKFLYSFFEFNGNLLQEDQNNVSLMFLSFALAHYIRRTFLLRNFYVQAKCLKIYHYVIWFKDIYFSLGFLLSIHDSGNPRKQTYTHIYHLCNKLFNIYWIQNAHRFDHLYLTQNSICWSTSE